LKQVPGVRDAAVTSVMPFSGNWSTSSFDIEGYATGPNEPSPWGDIRYVSPNFFSAMGVQLLAGRVLGENDRSTTLPVAVIDEVFAKKYFKQGSPIGRRVVWGEIAPGKPRYVEIVGVVKHTMHEGLDAEPRIQMYFPYAQSRGLQNMTVAVRTTGEPLSQVNSLRLAVRSVDRDMPIANVRTMDDMIGNSMGQRRLSMLLLGAFSAIALLLASIGIYGVMAYSVAQRTRELGIRMALGAARGRVLGMVIGQGMALAAAGIVIGLLGAYALTRLLGSQLYSVSATDPSTFALVAALLGSIALVATLVPALRATRVDPVVALRDE
jgi:putative ABC transport system permease protein